MDATRKHIFVLLILLLAHQLTHIRLQPYIVLLLGIPGEGGNRTACFKAFGGHILAMFSGSPESHSCQRVVESYPMPRPHIGHGGAHAYYAPVSDRVQLPELKCFISPHAYHATLFHELIHSVGRPARLNRFTEKATRFGDEDYSKEELIAEMGASFLCAFTGIREAVFENSVAYLKGWAGSLKADKTMIIYAATRAFKAASYILDLNAEESKKALPAMAA